jgi:hypothetical protein
MTQLTGTKNWICRLSMMSELIFPLGDPQTLGESTVWGVPKKQMHENMAVSM